MGFFKNLLENITTTKRVSTVQMVQERGNGFYSYNGKMYQSVHVKVKQRHAPGEILVDNRIRRTRHAFRNAQSCRQPTGEGGLSRAEISVIGNHIAGL